MAGPCGCHGRRFGHRAGRRAYAEWDAGGSGEQDLLQENDDGTWKVENVVNWMS
jgi:hypothetical protein